MPASSSACDKMRPAGPTNGWPARSSSLPGCSPMSITSASVWPSPNTVCVPLRQRSHARHAFAAVSSDRSDRRVGTGAAGTRAPLDGLRDEQRHHQHHQENEQEDACEHFSDGERRARNSRETEQGGDQPDDEKYQSALQHGIQPPPPNEQV